ncbi:MAG TPA: histidine kinase [Longimicrobium sp.]|nr:histidine kinase [Longimicrobium sp.]
MLLGIWVLAGAHWIFSYLRRAQLGEELPASPLLLGILDLASWVLAALAALALPWARRRWIVQIPHLLAVSALLGLGRLVFLLLVTPLNPGPLWPALVSRLPGLPFHMIAIGSLVGAGYAIRFSLENARHRLQLDQLESGLASTRYRALKNQLRPGLVSASLDDIHGLLQRDPGRAQQAIFHLSDVLRASLRTFAKDLVPLKDEVDFTRDVLALGARKPTGPPSAGFHVDPALDRALLPHLTLYSLAEAAAPLRSRFEIRVEPVEEGVEVRLRDLRARSRAEGDAGGRGSRGVRLEAIDRLRERLDARLPGNYTLRLPDRGPDLVVLGLPRFLASENEQAGSPREPPSPAVPGEVPPPAPAVETVSSLKTLRHEPRLFRTMAAVWLVLVLVLIGLFRPPMPPGYQLLHAALALAAWLMITVGGFWIADRFPIGGSRRPPLLMILGLSGAVVVVQSVMLSAVPCLVIELGCGIDPTRIARQGGFLFYVGGIISTGYAVQLIERNRRLGAARYHAESALRDAELNILAMQLRPHFIFNVLNTIQIRSHSDAAAATRLTVLLRELFRRSIAVPLNGVVPLAVELSTLDLYIAIERARYPDRVSTSTRVAAGLEHALVPHFILQPLVENAVRHGLAGKDEGGQIWIAAAAGSDGTQLVLEVRDNGRGGAPAPGPSGGVGLANVRARLRALYGGEGRLEISGGEGDGFTARIRLPLRFDASTAAARG